MTTDSKASDVTLLLCPFCGGDEIEESSNGIGSHFAYCCGCGGEGPGAPDATEARRAWNARSQQPSAQWIATPEASVAEVMDALAEMALPHSPDTERTE